MPSEVTQTILEWFRIVSHAPPFILATGLASLGGLVYSIRAFYTAKVAAQEASTAAQAARQARDQIKFRTASEELAQTSTKIEQLHGFLGRDQLPEARLLATEVMHALSEFAERRSSHISDQDRDTILSVRGQVQVVRQRITKLGAADFSPPQKNTVLTALENKGSGVVRQLLGRMKDTLDQGETL